MSTPNGYNNPAYTHQYDSSLYDYQYVPEIDPDSPDLRDEYNRRHNQIRLVHPRSGNFQREPSDSSEFEGSDESNRSVIIEECNNRRVTLICEKRSNRTDESQDESYVDGRGAYYQDISLESEDGCEAPGSKAFYGSRSLRHQRALEPPVEQSIRVSSSSGNDPRIGRKPSFKQPPTTVRTYQRQHRYEEIPYNEDCRSTEPKPRASVHRYAEITPDENGYPTLSREIKIEQNGDRFRQKDTPPPKPRAISPINYPRSFSPPRTPSRKPQISSPKPIIYCSSPIRSNAIEMSELSPPRFSNDRDRGTDQTFFIGSPKRQPPIGASAAHPQNEKCLLPKNLQQLTSKSGKRCRSLPNSPRRKREESRPSPCKPQSTKKMSQIFHIRSPKPNTSERTESTSARRNISNLFTDIPATQRSPYKPTTETQPPRTAIITPIFQRKSQQNQEGCENLLSTNRNFEKMSQAFQSTGNIFTTNTHHTGNVNFSPASHGRLTSPARIKRNQSVPNFSQTFAAESKSIARKAHDYPEENEKYSRNLHLQYSPKKPLEHVTSIDKSGLGLIEQTNSWSNLEDDFYPRCSFCFFFAAFVHLVTASATCGISFYLLSKMGRRYYLDFGLLAGFVNFILGLLGFRSYCWRWIPNRNYVSGFIALAAFSAFTCGGLSYLIVARPMAGDPILDVMGGAICAVSVLTIFLALTGLTMSGCCKAPPPDNRVTDI